MAIDTAFWRDLEAQFRALPNPIRLRAIWSDGGCSVFGGPSDDRQRERLYALYRALATRAGIATGANRANAFDAWLNLLREESPHFHPFQRVENHDEGGYIENLVLASAEYCVVCATRAFELEADAAPRGSPKVDLAGGTKPGGTESTDAGAGPAEPEPTTTVRKRGRPQTIPDERKVRAAALKASGGTNSAVAAVLYGKRFPTPQEVKNVPSHLRAFSKKLKRPGSSAQTSPRSPGIKG